MAESKVAGARHSCAPKEWRNTPIVSGSYELDEVIRRSRNRDVPDRLETHVERVNAYGGLSGYDGYHGYSGDN